MNILSFLNVSNVDNLQCDSGFIFQRQLGESLIALGHGFVLVLPANGESVPVPVRHLDFGGNKFQVRYSFDWEQIASLICEADYDVILSNQPELSANIRSVLLSHHRSSRLFTYVHYFPYSVEADCLSFDPSLDNGGFCKSILLNFVSGLLASDCILVHSAYAAELLGHLAEQYNVTRQLPGISILPPPCDEALCREQAYGADDYNILYNHRLYRQYGTEFLIDFARSVEHLRGWTITVTDLLHNRAPGRVHLDASVEQFRNELQQLSNVQMRNDGNDRQLYRRIIHSSKIALAHYRSNCTWSMSVIDCMTAGVPVVGPDFAWFREFLPSELRFRSRDELTATVHRLFTDTDFNAWACAEMQRTVQRAKLGNDETAQKFLSLLPEPGRGNSISAGSV